MQSFSRNGETYRETDKRTNQQTDLFDRLAQLKLNTQILLVERIWRTRIFPDIQFSQNIKRL